MLRTLLVAAALALLAILLHLPPSLEDMAASRTAILAPESGQAPAEVLVGVSWPFKREQDGLEDGLRLAQEEINAKGSIARIKLVLRDDHGDWGRAKAIAYEFAAQPNMVASIGYAADDLAIRASAVYESARMLHIVVGSNSTALTDHGNPYIVHTLLQDSKIGCGLAKWELHNDGNRKFAVYWQKDVEGETLAYHYRVAQDKLQGKMVQQLAFSPDVENFQVAVNRLKELDPAYVLFDGRLKEAALFLKVAQRVGLKAKIVANFPDSPEVQRMGRDLEGILRLSFYDPGLKSHRNRAFVEKFRARHGRDPDEWAAQGYDALHLLARGMEESKSLDSVDLAVTMRYMSRWEGAGGPYKFDGNGELKSKPIYLEQYKDGKAAIYASISAEDIEAGCKDHPLTPSVSTLLARAWAARASAARAGAGVASSSAEAVGASASGGAGSASASAGGASASAGVVSASASASASSSTVP